ncbi:MAG: type II toxin-antitoxin system RelE/ParE family toxin [Synergistaceae bacterium]|nr:type II toxin-antitoxin system RelE/ParE family toxin [Synergistaceae bacterium]
MGWRVEFSRRAEKELAAINRVDALRITGYLAEVEKLHDPRLRGKALSANLSGLWRYRVGSWRVLCRIEDGLLVVLVVHIGHRSSVYNG